MMLRQSMMVSAWTNPGFAGVLAGGAGARSFLGSQMNDTQRQVRSELGQSAKSLAFSTVRPGGTLDLMNELGKMPSKLTAWGDALLRSQEHLKEWSAGLSAVFSRREARQIARAIESGARTSGSAGALQSANDDLKDELQRYGDVFTNSFNRVVELLTKMATVTVKAVEYLTPIDEIADLLNDWMGSKGADTGAFHEYVKEMGARKIDPATKRPGRPVG